MHRACSTVLRAGARIATVGSRPCLSERMPVAGCLRHRQTIDGARIALRSVFIAVIALLPRLHRSVAALSEIELFSNLFHLLPQRVDCRLIVPLQHHRHLPSRDRIVRTKISVVVSVHDSELRKRIHGRCKKCGVADIRKHLHGVLRKDGNGDCGEHAGAESKHPSDLHHTDLTSSVLPLASFRDKSVADRT